MEQCFSHIEKIQSRISSSSVHWFLMASGCSLQPTQGNWPMCTSVMLLQKDRSSSPIVWKLKADAMPEGHWHVLKQNKGAHIELESGKDIPTKDDKPNTGCVSSLSQGEDVFETQGLFLCGWLEMEKLHELETTVFLNITFSYISSLLDPGLSFPFYDRLLLHTLSLWWDAQASCSPDVPWLGVLSL